MNQNFSYELNQSQQNVVDWLRALPRAYIVRIRISQDINPTTGAAMSPTVEISGGSGHSDTAVECYACERHFYDEYVHFNFRWYRGRFKEAQLDSGHRRTFKSIAATIEHAEKMIAVAAEKRAEHIAMNEARKVSA